MRTVWIERNKEKRKKKLCERVETW